jgi:predicted Zn-dependent protease
MGFLDHCRRGIALVLVLGAVLSANAARDNPLEKLLRAVDSAPGGADREGFEKELRKHPGKLEVWLAYCGFSFVYDQPAQTLALLKRAMSHIPESPELWRLQAEIYRLDAESGPEWYSRPGMSSGRNPRSPLSDADFRRQSLEGMLAALDRVMVLSQADPETVEQRGDALLGLERWMEAAEVFGHLKERAKDGLGRLIAKRGVALFRASRVAEAKAELQAGLASHPRSAELHLALAEVLQPGDGVAAAEERRQGEFYGRMVPGSMLDYSPEHGASLERMFGRKEGTSGMFSGDRLNTEIEA